MTHPTSTSTPLEARHLLIPCLHGYQLLLPGADLENPRSLIPLLHGTCLEAGLGPGGWWNAPDGSRYPVVPRPVETLRLTRVEQGSGGHARPAVLLHLPGDWARLWNYAAALEAGKPRCPQQFLRDYLAELWVEAGRWAERELLQTQIEPGFQAQADTDPRLGPGEVGVALAVLHRLIGLKTGEGDARFTAGDLRRSAFPALVTRFPVAGPDGTRRVLLRALPDRRDRKLYFPGAELALLHGGDTDGDLTYVALLDPEPVPLPPLPRSPKLTPLGGAPVTLAELVGARSLRTPEAAVNQVLGARVKDLTGILTYVFHTLARGVAVVEQERGGSAREAYREVFSLYYPLLELVMDARKPGGAGAAAVETLAESLDGMLRGEPLQRAGFAPFLEQEALESLERLYRRSHSLRKARTTAGGGVLTGGRRTELWLQRGVEALRQRGCEKRGVAAALRADLLLQELAPVAEVEPAASALAVTEAAAGAGVALAHPSLPLGGWEDLFGGVTYQGVPAIRVLGLLPGDGYPVARLQVLPWWQADEKYCRPTRELRVQLPAVAPLGPRGHCRVRLPGASIRLFRPVARLTAAGPQLDDLLNSLLRAVEAAMGRFYSGRVWTDAAKLERDLNRAVREWVQSLDLSTPTGDFLGRAEIAVETSGTASLRQGWLELQAVLEGCGAAGYDLSATSKAKPGSVAALGDAEGHAVYGPFFNPLYRFGAWGRRPELRGVREAIPLRHPGAPRVRTAGKALPELFAERVTTVSVALLDTNLNHFAGPDGSGICFDTILASPLGVRLLAPEAETLRVDAAPREELLARLHEAGVRPESIQVRERREYLGTHGGELLSRVEYELRYPGNAEDGGKVKALVGPMKGVLTQIPYRLFTLHPVTGAEREVHLVWPAASARKKGAADMGLVMQMEKIAREHGTTVDIPLDAELAAVQEQVEQGLTELGFAADGTEELWAEYEASTGAGEHRTTHLVRERVGRAFVGRLPVYRTPHTERASSRLLHGGHGMKVELHSLILAGEEGEPLPYRPDAQRERLFFHLLCAAEAAAQLSTPE